jgi:serine protease inhibitor
MKNMNQILRMYAMFIIFRADHPFVFIIQHNKTNAILFIGRVYEPGK